MPIKMPTVELLAQELARGLTIVDLTDLYKKAIEQIDPKPSEEDVKAALAEFRARMQFAWQMARRSSLARRSAP